MNRALVAVLACAALCAPAGAATYKWLDANGRIVYSDIPPQGSVKYETISAPPPAANPNAVRELAAKELEVKKRQVDAADRDKKTEALRSEQIKRIEQCQRAESNVRQLAVGHPLVRYNEKGETFVVDDAVRRRERTEVELWIRQNCSTIAKN